MFYIEDGRKSFYQWDLNRRLVIDNPLMIEVHYHISAKEPALICEVYEENSVRYADVPNIILQTAGRFRVYGCCEDYTVEQAQYEIVARAKPSEYVYTETEVRRWEDLQAKFDELVRQCEETIYVPEDHKIRIEQLEGASAEHSKQIEALQAGDEAFAEELENFHKAFEETVVTVEGAFRVVEEKINENSLGISELVEEDKKLNDTLQSYKDLPNDMYSVKDSLALQTYRVDTLENKTTGLINTNTALGMRISRLESRVGKDSIVSDRSISKYKLVPHNACPYFQIDRVGGMSYVGGDQLLPYDALNYYGFKEKVTHINGVTWTVKDGVITLKGSTGSQGSRFKLYSGPIPDIHSQKLTFSHIPAIPVGNISVIVVLESHVDHQVYHGNAGSLTFDNFGTQIQIYIEVGANSIVDGVKIKPMLNSGEKPLNPQGPTYEDFMYNNYLSHLVIHGANLYDSTRLMAQGNSSQLGSEYRVFSNASDVLFNNTENIDLPISVSFSARSLTYSNSSPQVSVKIYYHDGSFSTLNFAKTELKTHTITSQENKMVSHVIMTGNNNGQFDLGKIMVNWGNPVTYSPPQSSRVIDLAGVFKNIDEGVNDYFCDSYENGVNYQLAKSVAFSGWEGDELGWDWELVGTSNTNPKKYVYRIYLWDKVIGSRAKSICSHFTNVDDVYSSQSIINRAQVDTYCDDKNDCYVYFVSDLPMNEWKSRLADLLGSGAPVSIVYGSEWQPITDMEIENIYMANPGALIECVTSDGMPVPTTFTYMLMED